MKRRRFARPFSLMELLVALGLAAILFPLTLGIYSTLEHQANLEKEKRKELFALRFTYSRLYKVFTRIKKENKKKETIFFTSPFITGNSLVFVTDRGIDYDPNFSNDVLARLYVSENNELCLAYWPKIKRDQGDFPPPMHREVLLSGVKNLQFAFFGAPSALCGVKAETPIREGLDEVSLEECTWLTEWDKRYYKNPIPALMKLIIEFKDRQETLSFYLPSAKKELVYWEDVKDE